MDETRTVRDTSAAVLAVCGWSGSGKTTLLEAVIPELTRRGLRVAAVKHCGHEPEIDRPGKDSDRLFRAGADVTLHTPTAVVRREHGGRAETVEALLAQLSARHDVVLLEGLKSTTVPKVWLAHPGDPEVPADVGNLRAVLPWDDHRVEVLLRLLEDELRESLPRRPLYAGVLIGGASTRMGRPKASLVHTGSTFLEHVVATVGRPVQLVCLLGSGPVPPLDPPLGQLPDVAGVSGPLAGMLAAMRWAPTACWLLAACDLPRLQPAAIDWLIGQRAPGRWAILPRVDAERVEPLLALYEPQALGLLEDLVARGAACPRRLTDHPSVYTPLVPAELRPSWTNVNTPEELGQLIRDGDAPAGAEA